MPDPSTRFGDAASYTEGFSAAAEAALLVAANRLEAAEAVLARALADPVGRRDDRHWLMLLEVLQLAARRAEFDALAARYESEFGVAACAWGFPQPIGAAGTFALRGVVGSASTDLEELARFAAGRKTLVVDMSEVARVEFGFLLQLQITLRQLGASGRRSIIANASEIMAVLLQVVGAEKHAAIMRRRPAPKLAIAA